VITRAGLSKTLETIEATAGLSILNLDCKVGIEGGLMIVSSEFFPCKISSIFFPSSLIASYIVKQVVVEISTMRNK
jgi:hypothetical protein